MPSPLAGVAIDAVAAVKRGHPAARVGARLAAAARNLRIAAAKSNGLLSTWSARVLSPRGLAISVSVLNFAGCVNLDAAAGSNGFAGRKDYAEKEQSTDSTATDVRRDFNGRAGSGLGSRLLSRTRSFEGSMWRPLALGHRFEGGIQG